MTKKGWNLGFNYKCCAHSIIFLRHFIFILEIPKTVEIIRVECHLCVCLYIWGGGKVTTSNWIWSPILLCLPSKLPAGHLRATHYLGEQNLMNPWQPETSTLLPSYVFITVLSRRLKITKAEIYSIRVESEKREAP